MATAKNGNTGLEEVSENLVNFSVDRDDLNRIMAMLPEDEAINRVTVEYEIPLLKIVSVGWAIAYFLENRPEILFIIAAVSKIGAIVSLINPHQRGPVLFHSVNTTPTKIFIIGEEGQIKPAARKISEKADITIINCSQNTGSPHVLNHLSTSHGETFRINLIKKQGEIDKFLSYAKKYITG